MKRKNIKGGFLFCGIYVFSLLTLFRFPAAEYMLTTPEPITLPYGFKTRLTCEMNIRPDRFMWKFYPSTEPYNPKALIDLSNGPFQLIPESNFTNQGRKSVLNLLVSN